MRNNSLLSFLLFCIVTLHAGEYNLGSGYDLFEHLRVGGYISAEYKNSDTINEFEVDDIAVMGYGNLTHNFSYLVELEAVKYYARDFENDEEETNPRFYVERAYINYKLGNHLELTAGKFITPGSYWNQVPINVLRDLTSKPRLTQNIFPRLVSGLDVGGYIPGSESVKYSLFTQKNEDIDHGYNNFATDDHTGATLSREFESFEAGLWGGHFHVEEGPESIYAGATFQMEDETNKLLVEAATSEVTIPGVSQTMTKESLFAQASRKLVKNHYLAGRYEYYRDETLSLSENIYILGYNYRPIFPVSLKAEYQIHEESTDNMALFSFSILF